MLRERANLPNISSDSFPNRLGTIEFIKFV